MPLEAAAAASYRGKIFVVGGLSPTSSSRQLLSLVQVFDPSTARWTVGPSLPRGLSHATAVATPQALYVMGGLVSDGSTAAVLRLDDPEGPWVLDKPLPAERGAGAAAFDGERIVFGGGVGRDGLAKGDVWSMIPGADWTAVGQLSPPREKLAAATDGYHRVYFLGGRDIKAAPGEKPYASVDIATWTEVQHLGETLASPVLGAAGGYFPDVGICTVAGQNNEGGPFVREVQCINEGTKSLPDPPEERAGVAAAVLENRLYIIGGYSQAATASSKVFSIALPRP
jgi:N-acetylneuraminic acid mutarotase